VCHPQKQGEFEGEWAGIVESPERPEGGGGASSSKVQHWVQIGGSQESRGEELQVFERKGQYVPPTQYFVGLGIPDRVKLSIALRSLGKEELHLSA